MAPPRLVALVVACFVIAGCSGSSSQPLAPTPVSSPVASQEPAPPPQAPPSGPPTWDVTAKGIPHFITHDYIDLSRIEMISKFRSAQGHDYWDDFERCRSMKHYFRPKDMSTAGSVQVFSPIDGSVVAVIQEWAGQQLVIKSNEYPAFRVVLFHTNPSIPVAEGTTLRAGQLIGTHIGSQTWSDITVSVDTPQGMKLVSFFDAVTDALFDRYRARGASRRQDFIISREERDRDPLVCDGTAFTYRGRIDNWVVLR